MRPARQHSRLWGGGSRQSRRRLFERLEQEERRLKKHDGRWIDIQQYTGHPWKASHLWHTGWEADLWAYYVDAYVGLINLVNKRF